MPRDLTAMRSARAAVREALGRSHLTELVEDVQLAVSELVTNAIQYTTGPVRLRIWQRTGDLRCEVADAADVVLLPNVRPTPDRMNGRGLQFIADLTARHDGQWGVRAEHGGKAVWFAWPVAATGDDDAAAGSGGIVTR